jgi:hypothetical protein
MPEWLKPVDILLREHWGAVVTFVSGAIATKVIELVFTLIKARMDSKVTGMRESLYIELKKNIGGVDSALQLVRQGSDKPMNELVKSFTTETRYSAAKKDSDTFYKMKEADLIDNLYRDFKQLSDGSEPHPKEYADVVIAHFFTRIGENVLNKKLMKKGATPGFIARIKTYSPPPWWKFWCKVPKAQESEEL